MWKLMIAEDNHVDSAGFERLIRGIFREGTFTLECREYAFQTGEKTADQYLNSNNVDIAIIDGNYDQEPPAIVDEVEYVSSQLGAALIKKYSQRQYPRHFFFITGYLVDNSEIFQDFMEFSKHPRITPLPKNGILSSSHPNYEKEVEKFISNVKKALKEIAREKAQLASQKTRQDLLRKSEKKNFDLDMGIDLGDEKWALRALIMGWWDQKNQEFEKPMQVIIRELLDKDLCLEGSKSLSVFATQQITHNNDGLYFPDDAKLITDYSRQQVGRFLKLLKNSTPFASETSSKKKYQQYIKRLEEFHALIPDVPTLFSEKMVEFRNQHLRFKSSLRKVYEEVYPGGHVYQELKKISDEINIHFDYFIVDGAQTVIDFNLPMLDIFSEKFVQLAKRTNRYMRDQKLGCTFFNQNLKLTIREKRHDAILSENFLVLASDSLPITEDLMLGGDPPAITTCFNGIEYFGRYYLITVDAKEVHGYDCSRDNRYFPIEKIELERTSDLPKEKNHLLRVIHSMKDYYNNFYVFKFLCYKPIRSI